MITILPLYELLRENHTLQVLVATRTRIQGQQLLEPAFDVVRGEEIAEALDALDDAIMAELLSLPEGSNVAR